MLYMKNLLDAVLAVSQLEASKVRSNIEDVNIREFIEEDYNSFKISNEIELIDSEKLKNTAIFID